MWKTFFFKCLVCLSVFMWRDGSPFFHHQMVSPFVGDHNPLQRCVIYDLEGSNDVTCPDANSVKYL
jgi:hypothetical protein